MLKNIRNIIYVLAILLAVIIYLYATNTYHAQDLQNIRISQLYAFAASILLYFTLLPSPLFALFPNVPIRPIYIKARKAFGLSAALFALLHAYFAFFKLLGGIEGLPFLTPKYTQAILLSTISLFILAIMSFTSITIVQQKYIPYWRKIHRLVYIAGIFTILHAFILGTHFTKWESFYVQSAVIALTLLLTLEAFRIDTYLSKKIPLLPKYITATLLILALGGGIYYLNNNAKQTLNAVSVHGGEHQVTQTPNNLIYDPYRFNNSLSIREAPLSNTQLTLQSTIYDFYHPTNALTAFSTLYEKKMHMLIVDESLTYFNHIHPQQLQDKFEIKTTFPQDGIYHIYTNYQPIGNPEQVSHHTFIIGTNPPPNPSLQTPDAHASKTVGTYEVTLLTTPAPPNAPFINLGKQTLTFKITDKDTKKEIATLEPYLGAFGHLTMINQKTYDYIHAHPTTTHTPTPQERSGPTIDFRPMPLEKNVTPGIYRLFLEFKHNKQIHMIDFTIQVNEV
jgi:DMSO/TMAO reductase YedYZ heme-binding membrane subunit